MSSEDAQHIIDAIDGALDDWTVSGDAMRWVPEPAPAPRAPGFIGGAIPPWYAQRGMGIDALIDDDDGGLTPAWVAAQRRPMHHYAGLAVDLNAGRPWALIVARSREDAEQRQRELEEARQRFTAAFEGIALSLRPAFDAVQQIAERMGVGISELARTLEHAIKRPDDPPPISLRDTDPRQYALELRQTRNTGPSRPNAQSARRPRLHR